MARRGRASRQKAGGRRPFPARFFGPFYIQSLYGNASTAPTLLAVALRHLLFGNPWRVNSLFSVMMMMKLGRFDRAVRTAGHQPAPLPRSRLRFPEESLRPRGDFARNRSLGAVGRAITAWAYGC